MVGVLRAMAVGVAVTAAALGLAGPASADPVAGSYTGTMIDGAGRYENGSTSAASLTACGPDCFRIQMGSASRDLIREGGVWIAREGDCSYSLDNASLVYTLQCADRPPAVVGLTLNG